MHINGPTDLGNVSANIASMGNRNSSRPSSQHFSSQQNLAQGQSTIVENGVDFRHSSSSSNNTSSRYV